jgi:phosphotransferase system enzyme I (PtsI)
MELRGSGIGQGIAAGVVLRMPERLAPASEAPRTGDVETETGRVGEALDRVATLLSQRGAAVGGEAQAVLEAQALMARDPAVTADIGKRIEAGANAERAVSEAFASFAQILEGMGGYMAERAADIQDVRARLVCQLQGLPMPGIPQRDEPFVLTAEDLAPGHRAQLPVVGHGRLLACGGL